MKKSLATRAAILQKAFELIYTHGYQATSVDRILAETEVTKGAFFYHFENKEAMGLAIVEEILKPQMEQSFLQPADKEQRPAETIYRLIETLLLRTPFLRSELGCPVSNLTQEMTPWNDPFTRALQEITARWQSAIETLLRRGKRQGSIGSGVRTGPAAQFIVSSYWGVRTIGRSDRSDKIYRNYLQELKRYLRSLEENEK